MARHDSAPAGGDRAADEAPCEGVHVLGAQREAGKPHAYGGDNKWQQGKDAKDAANEIAELHKKAEGLRGAVRDVETRVRRIHHLRH